MTLEFSGTLFRRSVLVVATAFAFSAGQSAPAEGQAGAVASRQLPLWEISAGSNTIYLLGSVHLLRADAYPLDPALYRAFDQARVVAFEIDLASAAAAAPLMMSRGLYSDGRSLRTILPDRLYADLGARLATYGIPPQAVESMKPWLLGMTLNTIALQRLGYAPEYGVDMHFFERARAAEKDLVAFETIEEQIEVFDGLTADQQVALLESTLEEIDSASAMMEEISTIWSSGDVDRLAELMNESIEDQPELMERILYQRNRNWIPRIEALLRGGEPAIVIVGMGHMVGEGSVTDLLRERGYEVTPVPPTVAP